MTSHVLAVDASPGLRPDAEAVTRCWQACLRRFDLEKSPRMLGRNVTGTIPESLPLMSSSGILGLFSRRAVARRREDQ